MEVLSFLRLYHPMVNIVMSQLYIVTEVNTQNCNDITMLKVAEDPTLNVTIYADGDYSIITPENNIYQINTH